MTTKRLGLLLPSSGTVQEVDFYRRVPDDVSVHAARMRLAGTTEPDEVRMLDEHALPAARDLATVRPDVVVFSCTSAGALRGAGYDAELCARISEETGAPTVSTLAAAREALERLGARSVALLTPYVAELTDRVRASLEAAGIAVPRVHGLGLTDSLAIARVTPEEIHACAVERFRGAPVDAIFVACCTFRAFDAKPAIERALGRPVVTSNSAALAAALRILGANGR